MSVIYQALRKLKRPADAPGEKQVAPEPGGGGSMPDGGEGASGLIDRFKGLWQERKAVVLGAGGLLTAVIGGGIYWGMTSLAPESVEEVAKPTLPAAAQLQKSTLDDDPLADLEKQLKEMEAEAAKADAEMQAEQAKQKEGADAIAASGDKAQPQAAPAVVEMPDMEETDDLVDSVLAGTAGGSAKPTATTGDDMLSFLDEDLVEESVAAQQEAQKALADQIPTAEEEAEAIAEATADVPVEQEETGSRGVDPDAIVIEKLAKVDKLASDLRQAIALNSDADVNRLLDELTSLKKRGAKDLFVMKMRGFWLMKKGDARAVDLFRKVLEQKPDDLEAGLNLVIFQTRIGQYEQAKKRVREMLKFHPGEKRLLQITKYFR